MFWTLLKIAFIILILDALYITSYGEAFKKQIYNIQGSVLQVKALGAFLCYTLMTWGLYYFIIREKRSLTDAFLLGILVYGVFDTTNYALFKKWSGMIGLIDTLWGGILFGLTAYIMYL